MIRGAGALDWLKQLGFEHKSNTKSLYYDGHEREDVVADRMVQVGELVSAWCMLACLRELL